MEFFAKELSEATRGYCRSSVLGKGGFGVVYKGTLRYSAVAIEVLTAVSASNFGQTNHSSFCLVWWTLLGPLRSFIDELQLS